LGGGDAFVSHVALDGTDVSTGCGLKGRVCPAESVESDRLRKEKQTEED